LDASNQELRRRIGELVDGAAKYNSAFVKEVARLSTHYQYELRQLNDQNSRYLEENRRLNNRNPEYFNKGRTLQDALESIRKDLGTVTQSRDAKQ
jgi:DNA repair ATPase RecN